MEILITGGAHGIGLAAAQELAADHEVIIVDRDADRIEEIEEEFETHCIDVYDRDAVEEEFGDRELDVLVNCAGYQRRGAVEDIEGEVLEEHLRTNVVGPVTMVQVCLPGLRERGGRIVNVTSVAGKVTGPTWGPYSGSKHALEAISDALRQELDEVTVNVVEPGAYRTGFNEEGRDHLAQLPDDSPHHEMYERLLDREMRGGDPEDAGRRLARIAENGRLPRYTFPLHARLLVRLRWLLPDRIWDALARRAF